MYDVMATSVKLRDFITATDDFRAEFMGLWFAPTSEVIADYSSEKNQSRKTRKWHWYKSADKRAIALGTWWATEERNDS